MPFHCRRSKRLLPQVCLHGRVCLFARLSKGMTYLLGIFYTQAASLLPLRAFCHSLCSLHASEIFSTPSLVGLFRCIDAYKWKFSWGDGKHDKNDHTPWLAPIPAPEANALACTGAARPAALLPRPLPLVHPMLAKSFDPILDSSICFSGADTTGLLTSAESKVFCRFDGGIGWSGCPRAVRRSIALSRY